MKIVTLLERVIELNGLEYLDEAQVKTVNQFATKNSAKPESTYHPCILPGHYKIKHLELKKQNNRLRTQKTVLETTTVRTQALSPSPISTTTLTSIEMTGHLENSTLPVRLLTEQTTSQRNDLLEPMQQTGQFFGRANWKDRMDLNNRTYIS